jgi:hypothetical protein
VAPPFFIFTYEASADKHPRNLSVFGSRGSRCKWFRCARTEPDDAQIARNKASRFGSSRPRQIGEKNPGARARPTGSYSGAHFRNSDGPRQGWVVCGSAQRQMGRCHCRRHEKVSGVARVDAEWEARCEDFAEAGAGLTNGWSGAAYASGELVFVGAWNGRKPCGPPAAIIPASIFVRKYRYDRAAVVVLAVRPSDGAGVAGWAFGATSRPDRVKRAGCAPKEIHPV